MRLSLLSLSSLALSVCSVSAFATPIVNNGPSVVPSPIAVNESNLVATTGLQTVKSTAPGGLSSTFTANLIEYVYKDSLNIFGAGDYTFVMIFQDAGGSSDAIENATNGYLSGFSNFSSNVGYIASGSGITPTSANETNGTINFNFNPANVQPGQNSLFLVIETNATNYAAGTFSLIDSQTATGNGYVPAPALASTPEPSSLFLLGTGMLGVAGAVRRRLKR